MISEQKFTPGPWELCGDGKAIQNIIDPIFYKVGIKHRGIRVAEAHGVGEEETEANAHLIAACPTMYDFIKQEAEQGNKKAIDLLNSIN